MEYVRLENKNVNVQLSCSADWKLGAAPKTIKSELTSQSEWISKKTKTNRSMWPDVELVGVEIDCESPYLKGSIQPNEVELRFEGFDGFSEAYSTVEDWCSDTSFTLPSQEKFTVDTATLLLDSDEFGLTLDDTKFVERDILGSVTYESNGFSASYDAYQGWVSVFIREDEPTIQEVQEHLEAFISKDTVLRVPMSDIESDRFDPLQ